MKCLSISLNGKTLCIAGHEDVASLQATVSITSEKTAVLFTHGNVSKSDTFHQALQWIKPTHLNLGDVVQLQFVDAGQPSSATSEQSYGTDTSTEKKRMFCSFCAKSEQEVARLIAGPHACICNECIALCREVEQQEARKDAG